MILCMRTVRMHRIIVGAGPDEQVDHKDGDGLNNTRANLRVCTPAQNSHNSKKNCNAKTSHYKGVSWHKVTRQWVARIGVDDRILSLGYTRSELQAAYLYNVAAVKHYGRFARLNDLGGA